MHTLFIHRFSPPHPHHTLAGMCLGLCFTDGKGKAQKGEAFFPFQPAREVEKSGFLEAKPVALSHLTMSPHNYTLDLCYKQSFHSIFRAALTFLTK